MKSRNVLIFKCILIIIAIICSLLFVQGHLWYRGFVFSDIFERTDRFWVLLIPGISFFIFIPYLIHILHPLKMTKISATLKKKTNIVAFCLCIGVIIAGGAQYGYGYVLYHANDPLLTNPQKEPFLTWTKNTSTSMTITWESKEVLPLTLLLGTTPDALTPIAITEPSFSLHHSITLEGLQPNTVYYYTVAGFEKIFNFRTAELPNNSPKVKFIVYSDTQFEGPTMLGPYADNCSHAAIVDRILTLFRMGSDRSAELDYNFTVNLGDVVYRGGQPAEWTKFHQEIAPLASNRPYMNCFGNHEYYAGDFQWTANDAAHARAIWTYDNASGDELNYWFTIGNCLFISVATGQFGEITPSTAAWLNRTLDAYRSQYPWIITLNHQPIWSNGNWDSNLSVMMGNGLWAHGVDVSLSGHNHVYQRYHDSTRNWTQIISGGGGAELGNIENPSTDLAAYFSEYHFQVWTIEGNLATVQIILKNGTVADTFQLWT